MSNPAPTSTAPSGPLRSRADFEEFRRQCRDRWDRMWHGNQLIVSVGLDSSSIAKGAADVLEACRQALAGRSDAIVRKVSGNGAMWMDPWVEVKRPNEPPIVYGHIQAADVPALLKGDLADRAVGVRGDEGFNGVPPLNAHPFFKHQMRLVIRNLGVIDPDSIEDAVATGAYDGLVKALFDMSPDEIIQQVTDSGLRGRGGGGFPAGIKWQGGRKAKATPKFVICNSHEGEPNVYKDRRIHAGDPHRILEGILITCVAVGAERGYNYIGGEYPLAVQRFRKAVEDATRIGLIGHDILGSGTDIQFRVRAGHGAYICGEASAMMYSVMGVRGQPRTKPPRSVEEGLWQRPTVANNTETLANVPDIVVRGGAWYAGIGTEKSKGTKLMTIQGPLKNMGTVEVPMGTTMRTMIEEVWGGMREGSVLKGIQTGGVSAGPMTPEHLDMPLDFDSLTPIGGMLGSGGFVAFDQYVCAVDFARYLTNFNRYESCSKCTPCMRGNPALVEIVDRIRLGRGRLEDLPLIERTSKHIIELSLCGLGQVAPMPLLGMMKMYPEEFRAHIVDHVCPAGVCPIESGVAAVAAD